MEELWLRLKQIDPKRVKAFAAVVTTMITITDLAVQGNAGHIRMLVDPSKLF
jgi:hypothetical protein